MPTPISCLWRRLIHFSSNAKSNDPTAALESLERWSFGATIVILLGIVLEGWNTLYFWNPTETVGDILSKLIADALIGIGLLVEAICIVRAIFTTRREKQESDEKVSAANERAANAQKEAAEARERVIEIEQVAAWRHTSPEQRDQIAAALHGSMFETDLLIEYQYSDAEAWSYSTQIATIFGKSGVASIRHVANAHLGQIVFGIHMAGASGLNIADIVATFAKAGIPVHTFEMDLSTHLPRNEKPPSLYVFVGPRPPPELAAWNMSPITNSATPRE